MSSFEKLWIWFDALDGSQGLSIQLLIIIFLTLLVSVVAGIVFDKLYAKALHTNNPWDDSLIEALRRPVSVIIWIVGLSIAFDFLRQQMGVALPEIVKPIRDIAIIYCVTWVLIRFSKISEKKVTHKKTIADKASIEAIAKLVRITTLILGLLMALETLGFSISGVIAFGGVGGIAVGFAARDLLANFFGGLTIHLDRPFSVGDWIRSPDREIEGTVEEIGWRLTRITTFDKRPLYLPNSTFTTIAVENPSRMSHRRINETIGVRYDDASKVREIVRDVKAMLLAHEEIDQTQTMIVNFNKFAPSSLDFFIYTFTRTTEWIHYHEVKEDVLLKIMDIIMAHGAEVAFPTSTIHVPDVLNLSSSGHSSDTNKVAHEGI